MSEVETYKKLANEWLRLDQVCNTNEKSLLCNFTNALLQNPETRAQITALADKAEDNLPELKEKLGSRIEFGTAGWYNICYAVTKHSINISQG